LKVIEEEMPSLLPDAEDKEKEEDDNTEDPIALWMRAKTMISQKLSQQNHKPQKERTMEEMIPERYLKYQKVFKKKASERFPPKQLWNHVIDLKEDFLPQDCKVYPLTPKEQSLQDNFLEENL
jgi:hypothetical protein